MGFGAWLALALLVIGGAGIGIEEWRISGVKADLKTSQDDLALSQANLATSRANVATMQGAIDRQNEALKALEAQLATAKAALEARVKAALSAARAAALPAGSGPAVMNDWFNLEYGGSNAR